MKRCNWAGDDPLMIEYHDKEWGVAVHDDTKLFEFLTLEGAQAGLSWSTILKRRENYRRAFDNFDYKKIANYDEKKVAELLNDSGIIRNKLKIKSTIDNARAFIKIQDEFGSFDKYIWQFVGGKTIVSENDKVPATTPTSDKMSKDLKKRSMMFVGSTICYAFMQATGMVNDHSPNCFKRS